MSIRSLTDCFTRDGDPLTELMILLDYKENKTMKNNVLSYLQSCLPWLKPTKASALAHRMLYTAKEHRITRYDTGVNVEGKSPIDPSTVEIYNDGTLVLRYTERDPRRITYTEDAITIVSANVTVVIQEDSVSWTVRDFELIGTDDVVTVRVTITGNEFNVERLVPVGDRLVPYIPRIIREPTRHNRTC